MFFWVSLIFLLSGFNAEATIEASNVGCRDQANEVKFVSMKSKIVLNKKIVEMLFSQTQDSALNREKFYQESIELQTKHLIGFFRNTQSLGINAALSSFSEQPRITKIEFLPEYLENIEVDNYLIQRRNWKHTSTGYSKIALETGILKKDDQGISIDYEWNFILSNCGPNYLTQALQAVLPLDPYLSYWIEEPKFRKQFSIKPNDFSMISSCQSSEILSFGKLSQNWFFWSPVDTKKTSDGAESKCNYSESKVFKPIFQIKEGVPADKKIEASFFRKAKTQILKAYVIFGSISDISEFRQTPPADYEPVLKKIYKSCLDTISIPECLTLFKPMLKPKEGDKWEEPGLYNFLLFLSGLHSVAKISAAKFIKSADPGQLEIKLIAQLRDSKIPIEINVFFGKTGLEFGKPPTKEYLQFIHHAFKTGDLVSYFGHSGLGFNLKHSELQSRWSKIGLPAIQRLAPIWVGLYNCSGFSYFGNDFDHFFPEGPKDILLTLSTGVEADARFPLAQLVAVDKLFLKTNSISIPELMGKYITSNQYYVQVRSR